MSANDNDKNKRPGRDRDDQGKSASGGNLPAPDPAPGSPDVTYQPESGMPRPEPNQGNRTVDDDD
jgi:hypothetical protein